MLRIRFLGRVFPLSTDVTINNIPGLKWDIMDATVTIANNVVSIDCNAQKFTQENLAQLTMRAYDSARAVLDLFSFRTGRALVLVLETLIDPDGHHIQIAPEQPAFATHSTTVQSDADFQAVLAIVLTNPHLFLALRNVIDGISQWHRGPTEAAKAVDAIRLLFNKGAAKHKGWEAMRTMLNLSEEYLKFVTDLSRGPRHGDSTRIEGAEVTESVLRSWIIMNRYFEFLKNGEKQLDVTAFPVLM